MIVRGWGRPAFWYVTVWTCLVVVWALQVGPSNAPRGHVDWAHYFALSAINFYTTAFVAIPLTMLAWRRGIPSLDVVRSTGLYVALIAATSVARLAIFLPLFSFVSGTRLSFVEELRIAFVPQFIGLCVMLAVVLAIRSVKLANELTTARLEALQSQIHPHFLFNTLNAVSTLMHRDVDEAEEMLACLCDLLRVTLQTPARTTIPLDEELTILRQYLGIMDRRFPGRLDMRIDVPPDMRTVPVPALLLQPLVENVLQHGLNRDAKTTHLEISATQSNGCVLLRVTDDGPGFTAPSQPGFGIGMENTRRRLETFYGGRARLSVGNTGAGGAEVRLELPSRSRQ